MEPGGRGLSTPVVLEKSAPFDGVAETYDRDFTGTVLGRELRAQVWRRLDERFPPGSCVLELACGTGEDAAWLSRRGVRVVATDQSEAMLEVTRRKVALAGGAGVELARLDMAGPDAEFAEGSFDGAFSSFGGLNCVEDVSPLARALARWVRPGGIVVLTVMGPFCAWETLWFLARFQPGTAFRRRNRGGWESRVGNARLRVFYPTSQNLVRQFVPLFRLLECRGLGVALPPSFLAKAMEEHPVWFHLLRAIEHRISGRWPFRHLGDHYVLELERSGP